MSLRTIVCSLLFMNVFMLAPVQLPAAFTVQNGKITDADLVATMSPEEHFNAGAKALDEKEWNDAARNFAIVVYNFPRSTCYHEALFYKGVALYHQGEYDGANQSFTSYLQSIDHPKLFLAAIEYKYAIAEKLRCGGKRRLFGVKRLPKWSSGENMALELYDEVIAALPCHELAAHALYAKGLLLWAQHRYQESIVSFQAIPKRFPKHELAPESYLAITRVYLTQSRAEFNNPDLLALAQLNVRRFQQHFPREERLKQAECDLQAMKEVFGQGLYDTGAFYERRFKPNAAVIYYKNAMNQFPETQAACSSRARLEALGVACDDDCGQ